MRKMYVLFFSQFSLKLNTYTTLETRLKVNRIMTSNFRRRSNSSAPTWYWSMGHKIASWPPFTHILKLLKALQKNKLEYLSSYYLLKYLSDNLLKYLLACVHSYINKKLVEKKWFFWTSSCSCCSGHGSDWPCKITCLIPDFWLGNQ